MKRKRKGREKEKRGKKEEGKRNRKATKRSNNRIEIFTTADPHTKVFKEQNTAKKQKQKEDAEEIFSSTSFVLFTPSQIIHFLLRCDELRPPFHLGLFQIKCLFDKIERKLGDFNVQTNEKKREDLA